MLIDFKNIKQDKLEHFKGGKGAMLAKMFVDGKNKILLAQLEPGNNVGYHKHEMNSEIVYVLSGIATIKYDNCQNEILHPGEVHYCPQGHSHAVCNEGKEVLNFFAVVPEHHQ